MSGPPAKSWSTFCSCSTSLRYTSEVAPKLTFMNTSTAAASFWVSLNAGPRKANVTQGAVGVCQGTCAYFAPVGTGSAGISTCSPLPGRQSPQYFSTSGSTRAGSTSPATMIAVFSGRYQRSKKVFEYSYWFGMSSMSSMKPIVVCR